VRLSDGKEITVSTFDLAPYPTSHDESEDPPKTSSTLQEFDNVGDSIPSEAVEESEDSVPEKTDSEPALLRRFIRIQVPLIVMFPITFKL